MITLHNAFYTFAYFSVVFYFGYAYFAIKKRVASV